MEYFDFYKADIMENNPSIDKLSSINIMDITPLILFNSKVDRLDNCRLSKRMANQHYHIQHDKIMNLDWVAVDGVSQDDVDAFVCNLRLLIQDRDGFSIQCLSKLYEYEEVPHELSDSFNQERQKWKTHLNSETLFQKPDSDEKYSYKELFNIVFYGGLAHQDQNYIKEFLWLTRQGAFSAFVFGLFISFLKTILDVVRNIRGINKQLIEKVKR